MTGFASGFGAGPSGAGDLGRATVLVVEDEPVLRMLAVDLAEETGFGVLEAGNADEAMALLETHPDVRVVFTDIDMPGSMNGLALASAISGRWPPIGIILTSGQGWPAGWSLPPQGVFFPKPYDGRVLVDTMRRMAT